MILFVMCKIWASYYIQKWAYADEEEQVEYFKLYFTIVFAFSFGMGLFVLIRVALLMLAQLRTSRSMHNSLVTRVFRAPINLFFDVTPIGKILNRFSRDLGIIDE